MRICFSAPPCPLQNGGINNQQTTLYPWLWFPYSPPPQNSPMPLPGYQNCVSSSGAVSSALYNAPTVSLRAYTWYGAASLSSLTWAGCVTGPGQQYSSTAVQHVF